MEKFVANLHGKTEYVILIRNLKQALNHGLVLKKVHRMIKFIKCLTRTIYKYKSRSKKKSKN